MKEYPTWPLAITGIIMAGLSSYTIHILHEEHRVELSNIQLKLDIAEQINEAYYNENKILANEIVLRQDITSVIVDAAREYNIEPMLLAKVIKSESNFRPNPHHKLPYVVGPGGINTKEWKHLKNNPHSYVGNIYCSAEILSKYLENSSSLTNAIAKYKGFSKEGLKQAKEVVKDYNGER